MFHLVLHVNVHSDQEAMGGHSPSGWRTKGVGPHLSGAATAVLPHLHLPTLNEWVQFGLDLREAAAE